MSRACLATVSSDGFVPGTLTLLHSFLAHHPGWDGDLVVLHDDGLGEAGRARLAALSEHVRFVTASGAMGEALGCLMAERPDLLGWRARFLSLEAFRLDADRVLFIDSDALVRAPLDDLFERDEPFLAAGDGPTYWGGGRDRQTYARLTPAQLTPDAVRGTFNAGLMAFAPAALGADTHRQLLDRLDPSAWGRDVEMPKLADQRVLNQHLEGRVVLLPATDNYLLAHRAAITKTTGTALDDARVLHFNGRWKPWELDRLPDQATRDPLTHRTWQIWLDAYFEATRYLLARSALRAAAHA